MIYYDTGPPDIVQIRNKIAKFKPQLPFYGKIVSATGNLSPLGRIDKLVPNKQYLHIVVTQEKIDKNNNLYEESVNLEIPLLEIEDIIFFKTAKHKTTI